MNDPLESPLIPPALRDALKFSPDNVPLLVHAAESVLQSAGFEVAEGLFRLAVNLEPENAAARLGLASAFFQLGKRNEALVIVEKLVVREPPMARSFLLHARLAAQAGEFRLAARQYAEACRLDPGLGDRGFEVELGNYLPRRDKVIPPKTSHPTPGTRDEDQYADLTEGGDERERLPAGDLTDDPTAEIEKPSLNFDDVGGMEKVKEEVRMKIILPLEQPGLFRAYGKKIGGGILLYGPPGCGKTFLARATAGQVRAGFISVGISDVLDMWIGQSERNLHALFEQARSHKPCVLFFDEVDALGANRTDMIKSGGRHLINQFLSELDGVADNNEGVLVLAATNAPWHLDSAFRRPGRFDRILFVPPPDAAARASILRLHLKGKPVEPIDFEQVSRKTEGFSGADLRAVVDTAVEEKLREAMKTGSVQPLNGRDLLAAVKRARPTVRDWFESARNYALYANQSGLYDDVLAYLKMK